MAETTNFSDEVKNAVEAVNSIDETTDAIQIDQPKVKKLDPLAEVTRLMEYGFNDLEYSTDWYENVLNTKVTKIKEDELIKGKISNITKDEVYVDIGFKSYGIIPRSELINAETYNIGEEIDVFIDKMEDPQGRLILSRRRADFMRIWDDIISLHDKQEITKVKILRRIKGGMVVDLLGIEAFLPGSQIDVRPVRDFDSWVAKNIDVRVVKVNHPSENVVVSHKVLLEELLSEQRDAIMSKLEKGLVLEGTVKAISDFGIFIDLGGVDGLVHITDLSWGRVTHPSEIVELDQVVKVVVLDFDNDKRRISLGMKQLTSHPWDTIGEKCNEAIKVSGKVVSLTDYGAFIEIEKGIEGLIHISEMSWTQHVKHPSQIVSMGQVVEAIVLSIDKENKKLALGMKQLEPDPWEDLMKKYPTDSKHKGIVRNLTNFGVFVELEPGVDGLIHISDLSWTKKIRHPGEFVKKGDELDVIVLSIDPEQRRIALGHKQITINPWDIFEEKYSISAKTEAKIERIIEKGVIVELPDGVDGFVPVSQLSFAPIGNISDYFNIGDLLPLKVVEFDKEAKKIVLSVVEALREADQATIDAYNVNHPVPNVNDRNENAHNKKSAPTPSFQASMFEPTESTIGDMIASKTEAVVEPAPVVKEVAEVVPEVVVEETPIVEEVDVTPEVVVEETPIVEEVETTPEVVVEETPIVEEVDVTPEVIVDETPIVEEVEITPDVVEETPIVEEVETTPDVVEEETPIVEVEDEEKTA